MTSSNLSKYPALNRIVNTPTFDIILDRPLPSPKDRRNHPTKRDFVSPRIDLKDGAHISVQASSTHYCRPRDSMGPWTHLECGYPSHDPGNEWREYFDGDFDKDPHTSSVYGYVPLELIIEYIENHGGEA